MLLGTYQQLEVCGHGGNALCSVSALDANTLVKTLEEDILESCNVRLHVRLGGRRHILCLKYSWHAKQIEKNVSPDTDYPKNTTMRQTHAVRENKTSKNGALLMLR